VAAIRAARLLSTGIVAIVGFGFVLALTLSYTAGTPAASPGATAAANGNQAGPPYPNAVDGQRVVLLGDPIMPHGLGKHGAPVMAEGSDWLSLNGTPACREGHLASCGHPSTGRPWFRIP